MVAPSHGVEVTITHVDQDAVIYYSVAGEKPKCDDPAGTEYSQPLKLCGSSDQATIEAVACKAGPHAAASEVATQILNIRALSAPSPKAPTFDTVPADACREGADGALSCNSGGLFRVLLDSDEFSCSNPDWDTQADCLGMGFQWNPMLGCSELNGKRLPCITIYYTVDGSDPSVSSSSRKVYDAETAIPVVAGSHRLRAVVIRSRRRFDAQACPCCCKHDCDLVGAPAEQNLEVRDSMPVAVRSSLVGSPDVTFTLQTPFDTFQDMYYSNRFKWRSDVASALGLFHNSVADYRRVKGECTCEMGIGCIREPKSNGPSGHDICFLPGPTGQHTTVVSLYITSAGVCSASKSSDLCVSNSSCGRGACGLDASSWQTAYAKLQVKQKETMKGLKALHVVDVQLQADIDVGKVLRSGSGSLGVILAVAVVFIVLLCVLLNRVWLLDKLYGLVPSLKSKGRQLKAKVRQVRDEGRLSRHGQFAKMTELSEHDTADSASIDLSNADEATHLDTGSGQLNSLWATKGSYDKPRGVATVNPITAFFTTTTTTPQIVALGASQSSDDLLRTQIMEEGGDQAPAEWTSFTDTAEDQVRLLRELVGSTAELSVEIEYEPATIASRRPTLVQNLMFRNTSDSAVSDFTCKAAVPKYMQVQITPPSDSNLPAGSPQHVTQTLRLSGVDALKPIKVRLKLEYRTTHRGRADETIDVNIGDLPQP